MTIAELLKAQRISHAMTLADVARSVGVDRATVNRWENGIIKIDRKHIESLCRALDIDPVIFCHPNEVIFPDERQLIEAYRAADDATRASIRKLLDLPVYKKDTESSAI